MKTNTPQWTGWVRNAGTLFQIPLILGLSPVVGAALGWAGDRWLGTRPILTVIGLIAGFVSGIRETITLLNRAIEDDKGDAPKNDQDQ